MAIGVYPGSFDPFTCGHMDILKCAAGLLDTVVVAVLQNTGKTPLFSVEERVALIEDAVRAEGLKNVRHDCFGGLLVDYARNVNAKYIVRGLRAVMDFEYEFQIGIMNNKLAPDVETLYFMANPEHMHISASIVKEVGALGGSIDGLVPEVNKSSIIERLKNR